jgi:hypothetical protein
LVVLAVAVAVKLPLVVLAPQIKVTQGGQGPVLGQRIAVEEVVVLVLLVWLVALLEGVEALVFLPQSLVQQQLVLAVVEEVPTTHRLGLLAQEELAVVVRVLKVLEQPLQARRILAVVAVALVVLVLVMVVD